MGRERTTRWMCGRIGEWHPVRAERAGMGTGRPHEPSPAIFDNPNDASCERVDLNS